MASVIHAPLSDPEALSDAPARAHPGPSGSAGPGAARLRLAVGDAAGLLAVWGPLALFDTGGSRGRELLWAVVTVVSSMLAMHATGLYQSAVCALPSREAGRLLACCAFGAGVFAAISWLDGSLTARPALVGAAAAPTVVFGLRWRFRRWLKTRRSAGQFLRPALLLGTNDDALALWEMLSSEPELGYRVVGVVGEQAGDPAWKGLPGAPDPSRLVPVAVEAGATCVIVVAGGLGATTTAAAIGSAVNAGLHVEVWPAYFGLSTTRVQLSPVSGLPVLSVAPKRRARWQHAVKRALDVLIAAALFPLFAPIIAIAAICIKLEDRGPVIHHHAVIGRYGIPTTVLKLRTMVPHAAQMMANVAAMNERTGGPLFKASNDPRVTRVGRILRATSIDELPQLWNVLTGRMSLVGPRFALPHEVDEFDDDLRRRHEMRPGITGLWQTEARDNPSFSAYRRLDLLYVDNWSLGLDLAILANTAYAVSARAARALLPTGAHDAPEPGPTSFAVHPVRSK